MQAHKIRKGYSHHKTSSYVSAVSRAIRESENLGEFWVDRWRTLMINPPRLSNMREI